MLGRILSRIRRWIACGGRPLRKCGRGLSVGRSVIIASPQCLEIGERVTITHHAGIFPLLSYGSQRFEPRVKIGSGTLLGAYNRIGCAELVVIGNNVLFAAFVHITDHAHGFDDPTIPIVHQDIVLKGPVVIEDNCWLGFGCQIMPGVRIGRNSVVGAGAVVTRDIPPFSVAVGNPARVIRRYDPASGSWQRVQPPELIQAGAIEGETL